MKLITERSSKTIQESENHFNYAVQVTRVILRMIGVWPIPKFASNAEKIAIRLQNVICYFLFAFIIVPGLLLIFLKERDVKRKVRLIGPLLNCWMGCMKYSLFIYHAKKIQSCLEQIQQDWQSTVNWNDRQAMLSKARIGRKFAIFSAAFMYIGGLSYRSIVPLSKGRMLTPMNTTLSVLIGKLQQLNDMAEPEDRTIATLLANIVEHQIKVKNFLKQVEGAMQFIWLMEIVGSTILLCLVGYYVIMDWESSDSTAMLTMFVVLISFTISIFTNCYVGQLLTDQSIKVGLITSTINWYCLSYRRARSLILIMAISNIPIKISAGGMMEMSLPTFSNVNIKQYLHNAKYEDDIRYTVQVHRLILGLIGVWPIFKKSRLQKRFLKGFVRAMCCLLLSFNLIPWALYMFLILDTFKSRLKMTGALCFYIMVPTMYCTLILREDSIRKCMKHMEKDWQNVKDENDRKIMLDRAKAGRFILICATLFLFASGFTYRLIQPIFRGKIIVNGNVTIRPLVQGHYYIFFDPQRSPAYEIVFSIHLLIGIFIYIIMASVCGVTALFTMHACGQLEMLSTWLENLLNEPQWSQSHVIARRLAAIILHHIRIRRFLQHIQHLIGEMCFIEIIGSTLVLCLLGYYVITGWEQNDALSFLTYAIMLVSFTFNIFILCYIGEILNIQANKVYITCCTLDWYWLPSEQARYLILIIAMANYPTKLTAGKVIDLSFSSFGGVIKTAMAYLNLLRTVTM
ncbi:uncharacterized protein LOC109610063 isoform X2 [Camponotus floridanus]|uniref:uncharacterized protein LOC109610063 isoform X2 n=1 Tax=Camponotus floridanus TaxID=104421 RepID=UPI000DC6869E|nr:uncharacterized protein LOC109610063 isoform X2 [Camponotus floridanus]